MRRRRPVPAQLLLSLDVNAGLLIPRIGREPQPTFTELLANVAPAAPRIVPEDTCAACGCTDEHPCRDTAGKVACGWMRRGDPRCSRCIIAAEQAQRDPWGLAPPDVDVDDLSTVVYPSVYDGGSAAPWEA